MENFNFNWSKALLQSSLKSNKASFASKAHKGEAILEKSLINLL